MTGDLHDTVAARLKNGAGRYTRSRRQLVDVLLAAPQPLTVDEIVGRGSALTMSSVYRNLAVLEESGLVHRLAGLGDFARFELAEEIVGHHHHHLACTSCGTMIDVELPRDLEAELEGALSRLARRSGFRVASHRVDAVGACAGCVSGRG